MAEDADNEDKVFDPSQRRIEEARKAGRYAFSADLQGAVLLLAGVVGLSSLGPWMGGQILQAFRTYFTEIPHAEMTTDSAQLTVAQLVTRVLFIIGALSAVLFAAAIVIGIIQAGFHITPERLAPNFEKLQPRFSSLFSVANLVKGFLAIVKVVLLSWVIYKILESRSGTVFSLSQDSLPGATTSAWKLVIRIATIICAVFAVLGVADFVYQYRRFQGTMKMTLEEFKDEIKSEEGDLEQKAKRRFMARQLIMRKMLTKVPGATAVITNPTHYAIAIRYIQGTDPAPIVVAKGYGSMARQIVRLAKENQVPIVERPELARILFKAAPLDGAIPQGLFMAAAEVIGFVYKLQGKTMKRTS